MSGFGCRSGPSESESGCLLGPRASEFGRHWGWACQNLDIVWGPVCQNQAVVSALTIRFNAHLVGSFLWRMLSKSESLIPIRGLTIFKRRVYFHGACRPEDTSKEPHPPRSKIITPPCGTVNKYFGTSPNKKITWAWQITCIVVLKTAWKEGETF